MLAKLEDFKNKLRPADSDVVQNLADVQNLAEKYLDHVPQTWRKYLLTKLEDFKSNQPPADSDAVQKFREKYAEKLSEYMEDLVKGGRNLSLDLTINRKTQTFAADLYLQGKKGSQLEANLATLGKTHSVLGHLALQDSALRPPQRAFSGGITRHCSQSW